MLWFLFFAILGILCSGLAPRNMPLRERLKVTATLVLGGLLVLALTSLANAQAVAGIPCEDIRKLTRAERWYWVKRLGLSEADVLKIKQTCKLK